MDKLAIWWQYIQAVQDKLPSDQQVTTCVHTAAAAAAAAAAPPSQVTALLDVGTFARRVMKGSSTAKSEIVSYAGKAERADGRAMQQPAL